MVISGQTNYRKTPQDTARHPQDTARHCKTPTRHRKGPQERRMQGYYRYSGVWWWWWCKEVNKSTHRKPRRTTKEQWTQGSTRDHYEFIEVTYLIALRSDPVPLQCFNGPPPPPPPYYAPTPRDEDTRSDQVWQKRLKRGDFYCIFARIVKKRYFKSFFDINPTIPQQWTVVSIISIYNNFALEVPCGVLWCLSVSCGVLWVSCGVLWVSCGALRCLAVSCGVLRCLAVRCLAVISRTGHFHSSFAYIIVFLFVTRCTTSRCNSRIYHHKNYILISTLVNNLGILTNFILTCS